MSTDAAEWIASIGTAASVLVSIVAMIMSMGRANKVSVSADIQAVQIQMRALELDVARNYMTREQTTVEIKELAARLERSMEELARQVAGVRADFSTYVARGAHQA